MADSDQGRAGAEDRPGAGRGLVRKLGTVVLVAALALGTGGFGTVDGLGQSSEHARMTRRALAGFGIAPRTLKALAGGGWSFGAVGAADRPLRGLTGTKAAHCDGADHLDLKGYPQSTDAAAGHLEACQRWIRDNMDAAVAAAGGLAHGAGIPAEQCRFDGKAGGNAKCVVLERFGLALHASQDFYAHSNWTDAPLAGPPTLERPPGLGALGPSPWLLSGAATSPPRGLITGCFESLPEAFFCHGRVRHETLKKDNGGIPPSGPIGEGRTPRGKIDRNFARAVDAAIQDTTERWRQLEARILARYGPADGSLILCRLKADDEKACAMRGRPSA